jgi:hypothetical protein
MNSDYVTALRVQQHQGDLLRQAEKHRLALATRPRQPEATAPRRTARWWRRGTVPNRQPGVAGA